MSENIQKMFAIYDNKTEAFHAPFFAPTEGAAIRLVQEALGDRNTLLARHPADFNLFHVGEWYSRTAQIVGLNAPRNMGLIVDYLPKQEEQMPLLREVK